ncbi:enoyl-CoA hydratase [Caballeronia zhejiangensis]|uniref:enoyl-CoA hydratase n=1 Tax=Caballeronia zhejiangensis TaxID=871203 RepID=UPI001EF5576D|nr:enoyl-CoA hydratase [Caballeronia zhejiangensis]
MNTRSTPAQATEERAAASPAAVHVSIENGVGSIVLDNPRKLNAMSLSMWQTLVNVLEKLESDPALRCVVLSGKGEKAFCVGADVSQFAQSHSGEEAIAEYDRITRGALLRLQSFPKPTIAAVSGYCLGAGVALAAACDIRIAASGSRLGIPAAKLGLGYYYAGVKRLADLVGPSRAKQIIFTASQFPAEEMFRMGLIDELVEPSQFADRVGEMAATIAANAPLTIAAAKYAIETVFSDASEPDIEGCAAREQACMISQDYAEGRKAFAEKRVPVFKGH